MGIKFATWSSFLILLLLLLSPTMAQNLNENHWMSPNPNEEHVHVHRHHYEHIAMIFFTIEDLKVGSKMALNFPELFTPQLISREEAESIPFSLNQLPYILQLLSISEGSSQARLMQDTLENCESQTIDGEVKHCATSLESMLDFVGSILETPDIQVIATKHLTKLKINFQNYTILENPKEVFAPNMVACHIMSYPYAVFYCHSISETKLFKVLLEGDNGGQIESAVVCHMNTSQWSPQHVAFQTLGVKPGSSSICHVFPADNLVWVPKKTKYTSII